MFNSGDSVADRNPKFSITLPSNFIYNPHGGSLPKTPVRPISRGGSGSATVQPARFRLRRRTRGRTLSGHLFSPPSSMSQADMPVPSIEIAGSSSMDSGFQHDLPVELTDGLLSPFSSQVMETPTTPSAQQSSFDGDSWTTAKQREFGELLLRPMSQCSMRSISSDESDASSTCPSSYGTTCTSPDRNSGGDPFMMTPSKEDKHFNFRQLLLDAGRLPDSMRSSQPKVTVQWTRAMDDHLWTTYQLYLQDPTVTPIKTLPGNPPPLGVCHRVARLAKQSWKNPKLRTSNVAARYSTPQPAGSPKVKVSNDSSFSDVEQSNSHTFFGVHWPKQGATRRRLRELAKNRATIAPHYMRLIANRTPSPFSSSAAPSSGRTHAEHLSPSTSCQPSEPLRPPTSLGVTAAQSHPASRCFERRPSPLSPNMGSRDVRIALVTATSETMQPDGPLAQLQRDIPQPTPQPARAPSLSFNFNDPAVPFASPAAIPSSVARPSTLAPHSFGADHLAPDAPPEQPPRLGSPFMPSHHHTWAAPGRRQHARASIEQSSFLPTEQPSALVTHLSASHEPLRPSTSTGPRSLRSPINFGSTFPYNRSLGKRRAENSLEDASSPRYHTQHTSHRRPQLKVDDLFGPALQAHNQPETRSPVEQRRVRLRGFSLGNAITQRHQDRQAEPSFSSLSGGDDPFVDIVGSSCLGELAEQAANAALPRQLGSPFQPAPSSNSRPSRFRVRHLGHHSLGSYPHGIIGSIGERLNDL